jgi:hypothetical protein
MGPVSKIEVGSSAAFLNCIGYVANIGSEGGYKRRIRQM